QLPYAFSRETYTVHDASACACNERPLKARLSGRAFFPVDDLARDGLSLVRAVLLCSSLSRRCAVLLCCSLRCTLCWCSARAVLCSLARLSLLLRSCRLLQTPARRPRSST